MGVKHWWTVNGLSIVYWVAQTTQNYTIIKNGTIMKCIPKVALSPMLHGMTKMTSDKHERRILG